MSAKDLRLRFITHHKVSLFGLSWRQTAHAHQIRGSLQRRELLVRHARLSLALHVLLLLELGLIRQALVSHGQLYAVLVDKLELHLAHCQVLRHIVLVFVGLQEGIDCDF